jgi:tRNA (adenine37-N6)-methyltransferase
MSSRDFTLSPVGYVRVNEAGFALVIDPQYRAALCGVEGFSHVNVLWWFHLLDEPVYRTITHCEQPYRNAPPQLGIFATRSPVRPNPLGLSVAQVLHVDQKGGMLHVAYLDAEDGTPILDIKPYHPSVDRVRDVNVPAWCAHWPEWYEDSASFDWCAEFINAH